MLFVQYLQSLLINLENHIKHIEAQIQNKNEIQTPPKKNIIYIDVEEETEAEAEAEVVADKVMVLPFTAVIVALTPFPVIV